MPGADYKICFFEKLEDVGQVVKFYVTSQNQQNEFEAEIVDVNNYTWSGSDFSGSCIGFEYPKIIYSFRVKDEKFTGSLRQAKQCSRLTILNFGVDFPF